MHMLWLSSCPINSYRCDFKRKTQVYTACDRSGDGKYSRHDDGGGNSDDDGNNVCDHKTDGGASDDDGPIEYFQRLEGHQRQGDNPSQFAPLHLAARLAVELV
jgi:hypothetical protein